MTKQLERGLRTCERAAAGGERAAFLEAAGDAIAVHFSAARGCEALAGLSATDLPEPLVAAGDKAMARATAAQVYRKSTGYCFLL